MDNGFEVDVDIIAVLCLVCEGNRLGEFVAGHDVFEVVKKVCLRVLAAGLGLEAFLKAFVGDGGIIRESGDAQAQCHHEGKQEGGAGFEDFFHFVRTSLIIWDGEFSIVANRNVPSKCDSRNSLLINALRLDRFGHHFDDLLAAIRVIGNSGVIVQSNTTISN